MSCIFSVKNLELFVKSRRGGKNYLRKISGSDDTMVRQFYEDMKTFLTRAQAMGAGEVVLAVDAMETLAEMAEREAKQETDDEGKRTLIVLKKGTFHSAFREAYEQIIGQFPAPGGTRERIVAAAALYVSCKAEVRLGRAIAIVHHFKKGTITPELLGLVRTMVR
jgi:hypothetical protein